MGNMEKLQKLYKTPRYSVFPPYRSVVDFFFFLFHKKYVPGIITEAAVLDGF
jgi:hypothetical protein